MLTGRQASLGQLAAVAGSDQLQELEQLDRKAPKSKASAKKKIRSKRCRSLLMLSSPFLSSGGVKSSLMSLLHPSGQYSDATASNNQEQQQSPPTASSAQQAATNSSSPSTTRQRVKCVKMKLFEQSLDKLCSPKSIKQLNEALDLNFTPQKSAHHLGTLGKRKRIPLSSNLGAASNLRRLSDQSHRAHSQQPDSNNNLFNVQRQQMLLAVLPQPIRSLLSELYLRGPSTVGIFRKSPNAKHCKELRQKLESDSTSSVEQFQVAVIASVFKEWLRSLPDCLLMSRLYPQWMDAARLIEPLHQEQQQRLHHQHLKLQQHQRQLGRHQSVGQLEVVPANDENDHNDSNIDRHHKALGSCATPTTPSLRPSRSPLTDNGAAREPLDRARSCSTMAVAAAEISINSINSIEDEDDKRQQVFVLRERHSECLRIVRQLLDNLNQSNLILLRAFVCVLWHIAQNSHLNKMSATNLGVCVGQSLLNDDQGDHRHDLLMDFQPHGSSSGHYHAHHQYHHSHQASSSASKAAAAFANSTLSAAKRHRRSRSQCLLLSSSLSLSQPSFGSNHLESSSAQETAKYVPMLVAFIIENAPALFGQDVVDAFAGIPRLPKVAAEEELKKDDVASKEQQADTTPNACVEMKAAVSRHLLASSSSSADSGIENQSPDCSYLEPTQSLDHDDHHHQRYLYLAREGATGKKGSNKETLPQSPPVAQPRQQIVVHHNQKFAMLHQQQGSTNHQDEPDDCSSGGSSNTPEATSILIVNHQSVGKRLPSSSLMRNSQPLVAQEAKQEEESQQNRPLSATESTSSSSRASSSTSGLHSESPAFSSEVSDRTSGLNHRLQSSPSPSSVSSPSSATSTGSRSSPAQEEEHDEGDSNNNNNNNKDHETKDKSPGEPVEIGVEAMTLDQKSKDDNRQIRQRQIFAQNRYSTFMGVLNRVPKIPVQFTTSSYGGEAVIYNPRPSSSIIVSSKSYGENLVDGSIVYPPLREHQEKLIGGARAVPNDDSVISVKPNVGKSQETAMTNNNTQQQQYYSVLARNQQELREQRLKEFLAHQSHQLQQQKHSLHNHHQHLMVQQLPSVSQQQTTTRPPSAHHHVQQQQQLGCGFTQDAYLQHRHLLQQQQQQHPIFYSATTLNSLQQLQQQDRYLLYHQASLTPQRSHVMSLRDYYLSLQQQSQQQQHHHPTHQRLHHTNSATTTGADRIRSTQPTTVTTSNNKLQHQSSHQPTSQLSQQHHHHRLIVQRQYSLGSQPADVLAAAAQEQNLIAATHCLQARPQTRLAKIRQNQFNGIYVRSNRQQPQPQSLLCKPQPVAGSGLTSGAATILSSTMAEGAAASSTSAASGPSSLDPSSNESLDDYMNDWMESTMV